VTLVLQSAKLLALLLLCAILGEAAWTVHRLRPKLEVTIENADRALIATGAAAGNVEKASRAWDSASKQQASSTTTAMLNVSAAAGRLSDFVSRTDKSVNSIFLPQLMSAIADQNAALLESQRALQANLKEVLVTTQQAQTVLVDVDSQVNSPDIKIALDGLAETSKNSAAATAEATATMKDVRQAVEFEIDELEKPVSKLKGAALFVSKIVGHFFGF
jgi:hypothetical protein